MIEFRQGFIMLCNMQTEAECLERCLFGDIAAKLCNYTDVKPGDIGLLLNFDLDQLLGVFRACSKVQMQIEKKAWKGKFPAQIRVEPVGELQRVKDATYILNKAEVGMRPLSSGISVPAFPVHEQETIAKVLEHFKLD